MLTRLRQAATPVVMVLMMLGFSSCEKLSSYDYPGATSAYGIIKEDITFTTFRSLVDRTGMREMLEGSGEYTVFAPTNTAFINSGYTSALLQTMTTEELVNLVKNHIVPSKVDVKSINGMQEFPSIGNLKLTLQKIGDAAYADGGDITNPNQPVTNGYFNVINKVLVSKNNLSDAISSYANNTANSQLTFLSAAIARASTGSFNIAGLLSGTTAYTFFAPNNGAFIDAGYTNIAAVQTANPDVLGSLLKYQLIAGRGFTTTFDSLPVNAYNGTPIYFDKIKETRTSYWHANGVTFGNGVPANIRANNGVMHIVSRMFPVPVTANTLARIQSDANLSLFYTLIQRATLADPKFNFAGMLSDAKSSYTVFAVNNAGLQSAGYTNAAAINAETPDVLADILKFHIIPKRIHNISVAENTGANTLLKTKDIAAGTESKNAITFLTNGGFKVKGANNAATIPVITGNVVTTNGMLNIIGSVLKP